MQELEKKNESVNEEALWQVMRLYDVGRNLLNGTKKILSLSCAKEKKSKSEFSRIYRYL